MSKGLLIFLVLIFIVALAGTFWVFKEEEDKMKEYRKNENTPKVDNIRSEEYENNWLKTGLRTQGIIYGVSNVLSLIIALVIFM